MSVVTRFAPSPTGYLHIGSARTALFNWLYAQKMQGKFYLRIEDTDKMRSTPEAMEAILMSMEWMGLKWDGEVVYQSLREERHKEVAFNLIEIGKAYKCFSSAEEIAIFRQNNPHQKFRSPWRELPNSMHPSDQPYVIRLKAQQDGGTTVCDLVRGEVTVNNQELDDMILLRSDHSPTYMLAVVVDDYDMGVTHVIRGDDHFTNTFRQRQIIDSLSWPIPIYAHIPLIHGADGAKLSKRHGAMGVHMYKEEGYLSEAINNYLLRLGWSHGDEEIFSMQYAQQVFNLENIATATAKFDINKLNFLNAYYIARQDPRDLLVHIESILDIREKIYSQRILQGMEGLKVRAKTLLELAQLSKIYIEKQNPIDSKSQIILEKGGDIVLDYAINLLTHLNDWSIVGLQQLCKRIAQDLNTKEAFVMQSLRAGILGTFDSPSILDVIYILGAEEVVRRMRDK